MTLKATVYQCPECESKVAVHHADGIPPSVWCDCGLEKMMERVDEVDSVLNKIEEGDGL